MRELQTSPSIFNRIQSQAFFLQVEKTCGSTVQDDPDLCFFLLFLLFPFLALSEGDHRVRPALHALNTFLVKLAFLCSGRQCTCEVNQTNLVRIWAWCYPTGTRHTLNSSIF